MLCKPKGEKHLETMPRMLNSKRCWSVGDTSGCSLFKVLQNCFKFELLLVKIDMLNVWHSPTKNSVCVFCLELFHFTACCMRYRKPLKSLVFGFVLLFCFSNQQTANETQTESLPSSPNAVSPVPLNNPTGAPRFGTVTPNRIFVGGIDFKVFSFLV